MELWSQRCTVGISLKLNCLMSTRALSEMHYCDIFVGLAGVLAKMQSEHLPNTYVEYATPARPVASS
jgi:hypothetical protein